ncbi:hypothetical protein Pint_29372 [Pistacia integerrima]|uniref:Uncharacterized protein n=1 Tax=Pistacia integerrima TaxID=434235 RepID=A0ACC0X151_9ROSI|nr:hypothetical protein Pint_29372 [Pistacia integerrima]
MEQTCDGVNFASAGSGVFDTANSGVINLPEQLANFKKVVSSLDKDVLIRSVFLITMGGNDYFSFKTINPNATQTERKQYQRMVIGNLTNALKWTHDLKAVKSMDENHSIPVASKHFLWYPTSTLSAFVFFPRRIFASMSIRRIFSCLPSLTRVSTMAVSFDT